MVHPTSRSAQSNANAISDSASYSNAQLGKKPSMETTSMPNEASGSTSRMTAHRRKSSLNLDKGKAIAIKTDPKPSRSQGQSSAKRKEQNRIAQRAFRKRQKAHLEELEAEVIEKGMRIREITENNGLLLETMKQLQNQNVELKSSRAPNMSGHSLPYMQPTGTPLRPDRTSRGDSPRRGKERGASPTRSENDWGSSTDSHDDTISSPEATSPHALQGMPLGSDPHASSITGLQLNINPTATPPSKTRGEHAQHPSLNGLSPMPNNATYQQFRNTQQWANGAPQAYLQSPPMGANQNSNQFGHSPTTQMPHGFYSQGNPGPMARRYSDAINRHHVHSVSDLQPLTNSASQRPRTSISISNPRSKHMRHYHSMSVPNPALLMSHGSPQMMISRTSDSSPSQPAYSVELLSEQVMYGQPVPHQHAVYQQPLDYSSSSSSNVGLSFSPISHNASFGSIDQSGDYSRSSASYFSALSIDPGTQSARPQNSPLMYQTESLLVAAPPLPDPWADMMPSMGVSTPLQELPGSENPLNVAGSTPLAIDQPAHRTSHTDSPFLPEQGVFSMNGLGLESDFGFSSFQPGQMFSPPRE